MLLRIKPRNQSYRMARRQLQPLYNGTDWIQLRKVLTIDHKCLEGVCRQYSRTLESIYRGLTEIARPEFLSQRHRDAM